MSPDEKTEGLNNGALALVVHSVEIPQGVFYGKQIANAAADALSRLDLIGIVEYQGFGGTDWVYPIAPVGDRSAVRRAINGLQFGDMPSFDPSLQLALAGLQAADAGQKHCIVISDGDPSLSRSLLRQFRQAGITISLSGDDEEKLQSYWDQLTDGGSVAMPFEKAPWGDRFGMCEDRFGTTWMFNSGG